MAHSFIQPLHSGAIDIIGDIHGEYDALVLLLTQLGYDMQGNHANNRKLVFVGDFIDRGHNSPAVLRLVKTLIENNNAQAVLGNHELNLLQNKAKAGAGWYFEEQQVLDQEYEPYVRIPDSDKQEMIEFLGTLPLALENAELRIVHAVWNTTLINELRNESGSIVNLFTEKEDAIDEKLIQQGILQQYHQEKRDYVKELADKDTQNIPFLEATCQYCLAHQMNNPIRVLTSGVEIRTTKPFYASGKWRFVQRDVWWNSYVESKPVVIGHYWRTLNDINFYGHEENVFEDIHPLQWHGKLNNVFCVDFSVGARILDRNKKSTKTTHLVALQWPEKQLMLEDGTVTETDYSIYSQP